MNNDIGEYCHTNIVIATQKRGCLVHHFKQQFLVSKQHYTYFHTFFYPYVFPHMFSNNKTHVFKCIYQTPFKTTLRKQF